MQQESDNPLDKPMNEFIEGRLQRTLDRVDKGLEGLFFYLWGVSQYVDWAKNAPPELLNQMRVPKEFAEMNSEEVEELKKQQQKILLAREAIKELRSPEMFRMLKVLETYPQLVKAMQALTVGLTRMEEFLTEFKEPKEPL